MRIEFCLTKRELWKFINQMVLTSKVTWSVFIAIWIVFSIDATREYVSKPISMPYFFVGAISFGIGGLLIIIFLVVYETFLFLSLFSSSLQPGAFGHHVYVIMESGLHKITETNDTLILWEDVRKVLVKQKYLAVSSSLWTVYDVIPKYAFASENEYKEFCNIVESHWKAHA